MRNLIFHNDCLEILRSLSNESVNLIYVDPPFNTGDVQQDNTSGISYLDSHHEYIKWMHDCITECKRVLTSNGTIYVHLGEKIAYKVRLLVMDDVFGEKNWLNTIIWSFDFGGRSKKAWPRKHEAILMYVKDTKNYVFNYDDVDRLPYMAPGLAGPEKAAKGKFPTDVWWQTIVATQGKERVHYPNQKPLKLVERIVRASSNPGDVVLDFCAGSGTTCVASYRHGRCFIGIDSSEDAQKIMKDRFEQEGIVDATFTSLTKSEPLNSKETDSE